MTKGTSLRPPRFMNDNFRMVCSSCMDKKREDFQKNKDMKRILKEGNNIIKKGDKLFVKAVFSDESETEHMWVRCTKVCKDSSTITGTLDNEPVLILSLKCGSEVFVNFEDLEQAIFPDTDLSKLI